MILRIFIVAAVVSARTLDPRSKKELKFKLDKYQAVTRIDDEQKDEIWNKTMKNSKIQSFCSGSDIYFEFYSQTIMTTKSWLEIC